MIRFACPGCSATFTVGDEKAGKTGKCPKCQSQFTIPEAAPAGDAGPPSAPEPPPLPSSYVSPPPPPPRADDPVEIAPCPGCGARLSVLPSDLGQDVECPGCKRVYRATRADAPPPPGGSSRGSTGSTLARLGSGARAKDDDEDDDRRSSRRRSSRRRDDDDDDDDDRPRRRRRSRYDDDDRYKQPHRGGMILAFGIIGFFFLPIVFGPMAWIMGQQDLQAMDAGRMDESGRGITQAGKICGMIVCILILVAFIFVCGFMMIGAATNGFR